MEDSIKNSVAIVGMGCVFPNAFNKNHYWETLLNGKTSFVSIPEELWENKNFYSSDRRNPDKYYDDIVSYPKGFEFDLKNFQCDKDALKDLARREQYIFTALNECIENLNPHLKRSKMYVGHTSIGDSINNQLLFEELFKELKSLAGSPSSEMLIRKALHDGIMTENPDVSLEKQMTHKRISQALELLAGKKIPVQMIDAACASSLFCVELGILDLINGNIDLAICGGMTFMDPFAKVLFCRLGGSSRFGCFPFQSRADGTVFGDSSGFIAIKRTSDAIRDGDQIHAIIRGLGTASDGKGKSVYAPNVTGQVLAMRRAYELLEIDPRTIQFVEAHGTGTPAGDSTEYKSLEEFFGQFQKNKNSTGLGSVKGLFGHLGWAAGTASIIKLALSLKNKKMTAQHNFETLNPVIKLEKGPFFINQKTLDWPENSNLPRRGSINGFGFGGTNAHLVIEEFRANDHRNSVTVAPPQQLNDPVVVVGIGCFLPEAKSWPELKNIFKTQSTPSKRFIPAYKPDNIKFRIIDRAAGVIDNAQFMALEATIEALNALSTHQAELKKTTGVFVAQMGALNKQINQMKKVYLDSVEYHLKKRELIPNNALLFEQFKTIRAKAATDIPNANEDSNPGLMPNVISGRICNYFDLNGPNFAVNAGLCSMTHTLSSAILNLRWNRCKVALIASSNAAILPSYGSMWEAWTGRSQEEICEGAITYTLMLESEAKKMGLEPICQIDITPNESKQDAKLIDFSSRIPTDLHSQMGYLLSSPDTLLITKAIFEASEKKEVHSILIQDECDKSWSISVGPSLRATKTANLQETKATSKFFYIDKILQHKDSSLSAVRDITDEKDSYLLHHLVRGKPTLPGTFMIEIAAEAASLLESKLKISEIKDIEFHKFIRPPIQLKIQANELNQSPGLKEIRVQLLSDFKSKTGQILQKDILHFSCTVVLNQTKFASFAMPSIPNHGKQLVDTFHQAGSNVYLDGLFKTISEIKSDGVLNWGAFDLPASSIVSEFRDFVLPPLLFDGSLRLSCLSFNNDTESLVPTKIGSIKFWNVENDLALAKAGNCYTVYDTRTKICWIGTNSNTLFSISGFSGQVLDKTSPAQNSKTSKYKEALADYKNVFVTGATGFLGAHLLHELLGQSTATTYCLVRGKTEDVCMKRLIANLKSYGFWKPEYESRIKIVPGDLTKKYFGHTTEQFSALAKILTHVIHAGAKIAWSHSYEQLEDVNVNSCSYILELFEYSKTIHISYISTLATLFREQSSNEDILDEDSDPRPYPTGLGNYCESKRAGEKIMLDAQERGLPVRIFRPGLLCGSPDQPSIDKDYFFSSLVKYFTVAESSYRAYNTWDMTPIDFAAKSILFLANPKSTNRTVFNIINPSTRSTVEVAEMLTSYGCKIEILSCRQWFDNLMASFQNAKYTDHPMAHLKPLFSQTDSFEKFLRYMSSPKVYSLKTMNDLQGSGIDCPIFDDVFFKPYFDSLMNDQKSDSGSVSTETTPKNSMDLKLPPPPLNAVQRYLPIMRLSRLESTGPKESQNRDLVVIYADPGASAAQFQRKINQSYKLDDFFAGASMASIQKEDIVIMFDLKQWPLPAENFEQFQKASDKLTTFCCNFARSLELSPEQSLIVGVANSYIPDYGWNPLLGVLRGFFKSLSWELPSNNVKFVQSDLEPRELASHLENEIASPREQFVVVYKDSQRFLLQELVKKNEFQASKTSYFHEDAVVVFTGGSRGMGGYLSKELAKNFPKLKLIIIGRSAPDTYASSIKEIRQEFGEITKENFLKYDKRKSGDDFTLIKALSRFAGLEAELELNDNLQSLQAIGTQTEYVTADVANPLQMKSVLAKVYEKYHKIDVVIHCAGAEASKKIKNKTNEEFQNIFRVKAFGFLNLAANIKMNEVKLWINFGSHTSFWGNDGQTDYSAANDWLNLVNQYYNSKFPDSRFMTLNWPGWAEVGMASRNKALYDVMYNRGFRSIESSAGSTWFLHEILFGSKSDSQVFYFPDSDLGFFENRLNSKKESQK